MAPFSAFRVYTAFDRGSRLSAYETPANVKLNRAEAAGDKATPRHFPGPVSRVFLWPY
jgi:hypothetical protein